MLHCQLWPCGSLKSTMLIMVKQKLRTVNQSPLWLEKVKHDFLKSTMFDYTQTKVKMADQSESWFTRVSHICQHNQRCHRWIMCYLEFIKCYVALWCLSRVLLHCSFLKGLCHIVTLVKGCMAMAMPKMWNINNVAFNVHKISCYVVNYGHMI